MLAPRASKASADITSQYSVLNSDKMSEKSYQEIKKLIEKNDAKSAKRSIESLMKKQQETIDYCPEDGETFLYLWV